MGFFDEVKKTMNSDSAERYATSPKKDYKSEILKTVDQLLLDDENIIDNSGFVLGFAIVTNKRLLICSKDFESTSQQNDISFVPLKSINSLTYQNEKKLLNSHFNVILNISSNSYKVQFTESEEAIEFHKRLSKTLLSNSNS